MILWQDDPPSRHSSSSAIDLIFRINCQRLPVDHANALTTAILALAPWLTETPYAAVQPIHVAGSQNGWERPLDGGSDDLLLSKRTRLTIRLASEQSPRLRDALCGQTIAIAGNELMIESARERSLQAFSTLLARNVCYHALRDHSDEQQFSDAVVENCNALGFQPTKLLCGLQQQLAGSRRKVLTRSVLLAEVPPIHSLQLQQHGLGDERLMGFGMLIPNKDIAAVNADSAER